MKEMQIRLRLSEEEKSLDFEDELTPSNFSFLKIVDE
jgi:hypothetical protein